MDKYEQFTKLVKDICLVKTDDNFGTEIFRILKKIIDFKSGYIFFLNPERLVHSYSPQANSLKKIKKDSLKENLVFKNSIFGVIVLENGNFSIEDKIIFKSCCALISNIIKDIELTKVIKMQIDALQQGYIETRRYSDKIKETDEIKTKFFSNITHELRTPLSSILGFTELLSSEHIGKLNNKQKEYINDIKISGVNLLGMINEILDMSKIEANAMKLNPRKFHVKSAVEEVVNIISPLITKKNIILTKSLDDVEIRADLQKFQQILFNLLGNAVKFTPENGEIAINATKIKNNLLLSVKDNGIGIDKKFHQKIFKPFEQAVSTENSTGLGLAITKQLVKLHKGTISLNSEPDKGSEFLVTLPLE